MAITPITDSDASSYIASDGSLQEVAPSEGGGGSSGEVTVTNFPETQPVSGTVAVSALATAGSTNIGSTSAAAYADETGAAAGTLVGLLKGIYVQNEAIIALLTSIDSKTPAA